MNKRNIIPVKQKQRNLIINDKEAYCVYLFCSFRHESLHMSNKTQSVVGRGSRRKNSIPTFQTIPTVPTIPTIPTPWGCSKLKP